MTPPPELFVLFQWIGFALVAAAGAVAVASPLIGARRMGSLARSGAPDAAFDVANNRTGRVLGLAVMPLILGAAFYALGSWLGGP